MTTNSYGLALPQFDFPQEIAKAARVPSRRLPRAIRAVPVVAAGFATYYIGTRLAMTGLSGGDTALAHEAGPAKFDAMDFAYGDATNLPAFGSRTATASSHPPTPANVRFQETMKKAKDHAAH